MEAVAAHPGFLPGSEGLLSPLGRFLEDDAVTEILINQPGEVFIERQGVMERHLIPEMNTTHIRRLFTFIANENGETLSRETPMLSGNLYDGARVQLVIPPAAKAHALSIRRHALQIRTLEDYKSSGFYDAVKPFNLNTKADHLSDADSELLTLYHQGAWADFIARAVHFKKNIVISGQTASGKTTYLNACVGSIPLHERIITLEDTFEVRLAHQNVVRLRAPKKAESAQEGLCMQDLVQCALRLRPDRLIMGEIRGREVLDFISACSTGHEGSITSIHAQNPRVALMRMTQLYKLNNVPSMRDADIVRELHEVIDVIIQVVNSPQGRIGHGIYFKQARLALKGV